MAVNEINAGELIPGAYVSLIQKDSFPYSKVNQAAITNTVYALVTLLQQGVIGVIGDVTSSWTALSALMTSTLEIPQCSFAASSISFSDKTQFKYFFRSIVTNVVAIDAIFQFIAHEEWTKVGVIYSDDNLGQLLFQRTKQLSESSKIQLLNYQSFPSVTSTSNPTTTTTTIRDNLQSLSDSGARIIIVAAVRQNQLNLMIEAASLGLLKDDYVWIVLDETVSSISNAIDKYNQSPPPSSTAKHPLTTNMFNGVIWLENYLLLNGYPPYDQFISKWAALNPSILAYSCMMLLAGGFKKMTQQSTNYTKSLIELATGDLGQYMTPKTFNTGYIGPGGPMNLDDNGDVTSG
ncbi:periplasmic binding protein-like I [Cunninghamella echinulata]|nr:periplasmic binding protein-like I [Cunninghamella echinulata]